MNLRHRTALLFFLLVKSPDGFYDSLQVRPFPDEVVVFPGSGQGKGDDVQAAFDQPPCCFYVKERTVRRGSHPATRRLCRRDHLKEIRVQEWFSPSLEMNMAGAGKGRYQLFEQLQRKVSVLPGLFVNRAGAVGAGGIAVRGDFHLNPVPCGLKQTANSSRI